MASANGITITWTKRKRLLNLRRTVKDLDGSKVRIGYFPGQGRHPRAKMTYASLMAMHELRDSGDPLRRPVFEIALQKGGKQYRASIERKIGRHLRRGVFGGGGKAAMLESIAKRGIKMIDPIFGDTTLLRANAKETIRKKGRNEPMVHFGDLADALTFRIKK